MEPSWKIALAASMLCVVPAAARAQSCVGGREATDATEGRCCWPEQSWSEAHGRCSGTPRCPPGRAAEGDACVTDAMASVLGSPSDAPSSDALVWPLVSPDLGAGVVNPRMVRHDGDMGFVIAGATVFAIGYVAGILTGVFDQLGSNCSLRCESWPLGFVPVAGGVLAGTVSLSGWRYSTVWAFTMGLPAAVAQTTGLALFLVGVLLRSEELVPSPADLRVVLLPYAAPGEGGVTLGLEL